MNISVYNSYFRDVNRGINPTAAPRSSRPETKKRAERDSVLLHFQTAKDDESFARALAGQMTARVLSSSVPQSRLDELAHQVEEGTYRPDPAAIAGRLLGLE